ncbi:unnamed protein product [Bursaphelenchus xylophilus]|uniref:(pine wood nematode) hypothetical protein n=1 Tax=Bursaphelenchus xylophilus TaxID=6326 RepID=A0A1I7RNS6_BURXY|nr:unnamed protein product [Bursaphelenchus xylophilus]CAG9124258.1 unnamed protein product [Bursaphelenchus xylophilus]
MALFWIAFLVFLPLIRSQQAYCWDACTYNCPNRGPRLCPNEGIMTYYDCCPEGCCEYVKWPNLIFLIFIILALLCGCGCCCFFLVTDAQKRYKDGDHSKRSRRWNKSQRRRGPQELDVSTIESNQSRSPKMAPPPPPRYYEHRRSTVV